MLTTLSETRKWGTPFWDEADAGELCLVGCYPAAGLDVDGFDCVADASIVGVIDADGMFRAEESEAFTPRDTFWVCDDHENAGLVRLGG